MSSTTTTTTKTTNPCCQQQYIRQQQYYTTRQAMVGLSLRRTSRRKSHRSSILYKTRPFSGFGVGNSSSSPIGGEQSTASVSVLAEHHHGGKWLLPHHSQLPSYNDFLHTKLVEQQLEDELKVGRSLRPADSKWWHGVFVFSIISMLACIVTLWAPYPIGSRVPTAEIIATVPLFSNGCRVGLKSCICPRATICADDLLSMILLTIARSSAWFNYPLYMMMFLSKAKNLGNLLQKSVLRCWINFSDLHHVHSLFGIIVGLESISHTFFHILRWARRKEDIQVIYKVWKCWHIFIVLLHLINPCCLLDK